MSQWVKQLEAAQLRALKKSMCIVHRQLTKPSKQPLHWQLWEKSLCMGRGVEEHMGWGEWTKDTLKILEGLPDEMAPLLW